MWQRLPSWSCARPTGTDVGNDSVTAAYNRSRQADTTARRLTADLLNRSLLSDFLPVQGMRGLGLYMIDSIGPLRRAVMREGVIHCLIARLRGR